MKWFHDLKIRTKLLAGFAFVALIAGTVGYVGIRNIRSSHTAYDSLLAKQSRSMTDVMDMGVYFQRIRVNLHKLPIVKIEDRQHFVDRVSGIQADMLKSADDYEKTTGSSTTKEAFSAFKEADANFVPYVDQIEKLALAGNDKEVSRMLMVAGYEAAKAEENAIAKLRDAEISKNNADSAALTAASRQTVNFMIILLAAGVALAAGLGLFISNIIGHPIRELVILAGKVAAGDVSKDVKANNKDEIGDLRRAFGEMTETLREMVAESTSINQAAQDGEFYTRGNVDNFKGSYREIIEGINSTLDRFVRHIVVTVDNVELISKGEIPPKIDLIVTGNFNRTKIALNNCIDNLQNIINEDGGAALKAAANKDLTARVNRDYPGAYQVMKNNINDLLQSLEDSLSHVSVGSEQVASASQQISSGSQVLAQGASEQASSLEEISSSLQEMESMTRQNSGNAKEARSLAEAAKQSAERGVDSMTRLSEAIDKIKSSSDETAKIVKTIDEIAFQTNLLALNAAVEAARAGDAGKGFAVVAEEVRNLAMRSAEAARNTADLIDGAVKNADGGVAINHEVLTNLSEINDQVNKVSEVMAEIAAASDQQSQGIQQVNTSIGHLDQITQQNAANSEESASAAEELSSQAQEMQSMVSSFKLSQSATIKRSDYSNRAAINQKVGSITRSGSRRKASPTADPAEIIPLDDNDIFQEF